MLVYGEFECFGMQMLYVCVLCASNTNTFMLEIYKTWQ